MLPYAVLRAAAWPIEAVTVFAAPELASLVESMQASEGAVLERREAVEAALHAAIPQVRDRATRAYLLAVKRHVHGSTQPLPVPAPQIALTDYPGIAAVIAHEHANRCALAAAQSNFEQQHDAALEDQRAALRRLTSEHRFQRALLVANPLVGRAWLAGPGASQRPKRQRHLETTVFHYAMRACGRATPNGAWAGVAPVLPSQTDLDGPPTASLRSLPREDASVGRGALSAADTRPLAVTTTRPRYVVAVSLQPFVLMARALGRQARYRWGRRLRLNPTVRAEPDGGWRYERDQGAVHAWVSLPTQPLLAALIDAYADGQPREATPLVDALSGLWPGDATMRGTLERLVDWLVDRDVLRCEPRLPPSAPDAWTALAGLTAHLDDADRVIWEQTIERLHQQCHELAQQFDHLAPAQVDGCLTAIEAELQHLWSATGLDGSPPPPLVHLDMRLGFEVTWTAAAIAEATQTVEALLAFHAGDGGAEIFRRQSLGDIFATLDGEDNDSAPALAVLDRLGWQVPPRPRSAASPGEGPEFSDTLEFVLGQMPPESRPGQAAREYCRAWERLLEPVHMAKTFTLPHGQPSSEPWPSPGGGTLPGPGGAVLLRLAADDAFWIGPARPEAGLFAARFAPLLEAPILEALRDRIGAAHRAGVTPVEVVGWDATNPNGALHPLLTARALDPHDLRDIWVTADPVGQRVWLRDASRDACRDAVLVDCRAAAGDGGPRREGEASRLLAPMYSTGADIGYHDVCSRLLVVVAASHGWEFPSFQTPPLRAERVRWKHLPRLRLAGGQVLRPERWTLDRAALERVSAASGSGRYLAWRGEVHRLSLPDLVHVRCGPHQPELLLRTDSPLAVHCLFESLAARAPWMELSELPGTLERWPVQDADGNHYLAELAVSWFADGYWQAVVPSTPG